MLKSRPSAVPCAKSGYETPSDCFLAYFNLEESEDAHFGTYVQRPPISGSHQRREGVANTPSADGIYCQLVHAAYNLCLEDGNTHCWRMCFIINIRFDS